MNAQCYNILKLVFGKIEKVNRVYIHMVYKLDAIFFMSLQVIYSAGDSCHTCAAHL